MPALADDLRHRSDEALIHLLSARPDLAAPVPTSLVALAARAATRPSVERALALLDRRQLDAAEALVVLTDVQPKATATTLAAVSNAVGSDAAAAVGRLRELGLATGPDDALLPLPAVVDALGPYPAGLGPSLHLLGPPSPEAARPPVSPEALAQALDGAPESAVRILDALRWGPPVGTIEPEHPGPGSSWLLDRGVLHRLSRTQAVLPREVALAARGGRTHRPDQGPPITDAPVRPVALVAAESARAADDVARHVATLLDLWDREPPATLRTGGVGTRELRRAASALGVPTEEAAFVLELAAMAELVGPWSGGEEPTWLPTLAGERWLELPLPQRWAVLAVAWRTSSRTPWLVGTRNEKGDLRAALARGLERPWAVALRSQVLGALDAWPTGAAPDPAQVHELLLWRAPRATPPAPASAAVLNEAARLGLTGAGALSRSGRTLLAIHHDGAHAALADSLEADLPPLVGDIVIQGDLTGLVPGRPEPELAALLEATAQVESRGSAVTVRFTAGSIRRGLERGLDGEQILASLRRHSRMPLPQPLEYLVADAARKHGSLRVGVAGSFLRSEDATALAALAADPRLTPLRLQAVAPTVLVSPEPAARVLDLLKAHEVGAVLEGPDGSVISVERAQRQARGVRGRPVGGGAAAAGGAPSSAGDGAGWAQIFRLAPDGTGAPLGADASFLAGLVGQMRAGDRQAAAAAAAGGGVTAPAHIVAVLREAAADGVEVMLDVAGPTGLLQHRRLRPLSVEVGRLRGLDVARQSELTIAVHRIARVVRAG